MGCSKTTSNVHPSATSTGVPPSSTHPSAVSVSGTVVGVYVMPTISNPTSSAGTVSVRTTFWQSASKHARSIV